jgi:hypothetical protein
MNLLSLLCIALFVVASNVCALQISKVTGGCGQNITGQPPGNYPDKVQDTVFADSIIIRVNFRDICCIPYNIFFRTNLSSDTLFIQDTCNSTSNCYCACECYYQYRINLSYNVPLPIGLKVVKISNNSAKTTLFSGFIPSNYSSVYPYLIKANTLKERSGHFYDLNGKRIAKLGKGIYISGQGKLLNRIKIN